MTTDEHNPTSQPWPPSQPADTAGGESDTTPSADPVADAESATEAETATPAGPAEPVNEPADASLPEPAATDGAVNPESDAAGAPWPADPAAGSWGGADGFAPPGPDGNGGQYSAVPFDQLAPPVPGGFSTPAGPGSDQFPQPDQFPAGAGYPSGQFVAPDAGQPQPLGHGSGQFAQPDPNQFQPANTGYASGQFVAPGADQFQPPNSAHGSGQFQQPDPNQFQPGGGGFPPPDPNQFQAANFAANGAQFDQPYPGQYQAPGPAGQFDPQSGGFQAPDAAGPPGSGQFEQQPGGFRAPEAGGQYGSGQFEQQPGGFQAPGPGGGQYGSGQFPAAGPNPSLDQLNPEQAPNTGALGPDGGRFDQTPGGYAPAGAPDPGAGPQGDPAGGPIYSWAPPPIPAAPPLQQPYQQVPPAAHNPPTGQFEQPGWGAGPGQPAPGAPQPQQQFQQPGQPPQGQFQPRHMPEPGQPGHSVNDLNLLKRARKAPRGGWRRAVHKVSRGVINPGESAADVVHRDLVSRVNAPVHGDFRIAILSLKGGVGKTTTTVGLGATFASLRGDRVIAIDANPDLGTLAHRVPRQTRSTVRNLLEDQNITRYSDVRAHTSQSPSRLEVLASEQDPAVSEAFSEADYRRAIGILQSFYNIILTDCGTGLMHSAMSGVLDMASSLVLVTSPAIDGARSASATLDWLDYHGYSHLVRQTVVVVNASRRGSTSVNLDHLRRLFLDRTRAVQVVPFDDHLAEGAEIDLELVSKPTRQALLELAAMVADDFSNVDGYPYGGNRY
ncbi:AAA family ATPase [Nocardia sp. CA-290969]|uniref:nucleotide-binding protein n=1 Tax=Nocardia sp. CA-290969 TaxID=3239986 RepID=UPI003D91EA98